MGRGSGVLLREALLGLSGLVFGRTAMSYVLSPWLTVCPGWSPASCPGLSESNLGPCHLHETLACCWVPLGFSLIQPTLLGDSVGRGCSSRWKVSVSLT